MQQSINLSSPWFVSCTSQLSHCSRRRSPGLLPWTSSWHFVAWSKTSAAPWSPTSIRLIEQICVPCFSVPGSCMHIPCPHSHPRWIFAYISFQYTQVKPTLSFNFALFMAFRFPASVRFVCKGGDGRFRPTYPMSAFLIFSASVLLLLCSSGPSAGCLVLWITLTCLAKRKLS